MRFPVSSDCLSIGRILRGDAFVNQDGHHREVVFSRSRPIRAVNPKRDSGRETQESACERSDDPRNSVNLALRVEETELRMDALQYLLRPCDRHLVIDRGSVLDQVAIEPRVVSGLGVNQALARRVEEREGNREDPVRIWQLCQKVWIFQVRDAVAETRPNEDEVAGLVGCQISGSAEILTVSACLQSSEFLETRHLSDLPASRREVVLLVADVNLAGDNVVELAGVARANRTTLPRRP